MAKRSNGARLVGSYLKQLREEWGLTLKEFKFALSDVGFTISSEQLSRVERGLRTASLDLIRAAAQVYDIAEQLFFDIQGLPLEDAHPSAGDDVNALWEQARQAISRTENGTAIGCYTRIIALEESGQGSTGRLRDAVVSRAQILVRIGLLSLAESEVRRVLDGTVELLRGRATLVLAIVLSERGEQYSSLVWAQEAARLIETFAPVTALHAKALHVLAESNARTGSYDRARKLSREAKNIYRRNGQEREVALVDINRASYLVSCGCLTRGIRELRYLIPDLATQNFIRLEALAEANLGEALLRRGESKRALAHLDRSDQLAGRPGQQVSPILFHNAYHRWTIAENCQDRELSDRMWRRMIRLRRNVSRARVEVNLFERARNERNTA